MSTKLALAFVILAACGSSKSDTSPAGPVGGVIDLRGRITDSKAATAAPRDEEATRHEFPVDVHGVKAKVVWRTHDVAGAAYILSVGWEVVSPAKGILLEPIGTLNTENAGTAEAPVQSEIVRVRWHDKSSTGTEYGEMSVKIDAHGKGRVI